jgi:hypothetical protein
MLHFLNWGLAGFMVPFLPIPEIRHSTPISPLSDPLNGAPKFLTSKANSEQRMNLRGIILRPVK